MAAPPGAVVSITYDYAGEGAGPAVDDLLRTGRGRWYRVLASRTVKDKPTRYRISCLVIGEMTGVVPDDRRVFELAFYKRTSAARAVRGAGTKAPRRP